MNRALKFQWKRNGSPDTNIIYDLPRRFPALVKILGRKIISIRERYFASFPDKTIDITVPV